MNQNQKGRLQICNSCSWFIGFGCTHKTIEHFGYTLNQICTEYDDKKSVTA